MSAKVSKLIHQMDSKCFGEVQNGDPLTGAMVDSVPHLQITEVMPFCQVVRDEKSRSASNKGNQQPAETKYKKGAGLME